MHLFYDPDLMTGSNMLTGEEHHHCTQVLRSKPGDQVYITDGKGNLAEVKLGEISKKQVVYEVLNLKEVPAKNFAVHLVIAPTKQMERMEWMVEKACEIGVDSITFLQTANSERTVIKTDRLEKKAISALKQSKGAWMTQIQGLTSWNQFLNQSITGRKLIAVVAGNNVHVSKSFLAGEAVTILIGPEGDFNDKEVNQAIEHGFNPISLGNRVMRTETAGLLACHAVNLVNLH